jgi:hypothetical protein
MAQAFNPQQGSGKTPGGLPLQYGAAVPTQQNRSAPNPIIQSGGGQPGQSNQAKSLCDNLAQQQQPGPTGTDGADGTRGFCDQLKNSGGPTQNY